MKKLGLISLVVVMALGVLGVGYAYWTDTLYINGTVNTGKLDATFGTTSEQSPYNIGNITNAAGVAHVDVTLADEVATIVVTNAYPGMTVVVPLVVTNNGTIPEDINVGTKTDDGDVTIDVTGSAADLAVNGTSTFNVTITVDSEMTGDMNHEFTVSCPLNVTQFNAP